MLYYSMQINGCAYRRLKMNTRNPATALCPPAATSARTVLIAGATGLIGRFLLQGLLADPSVATVHALTRRPLAFEHSKLQTHIVDLRQLPALPPIQEVYLSLGTTLKVAGSQAAFRAIDLDANLALAHAAMQAGAQRLGVVSAAGADAASAVFYNRVKGELEDALKQLPLAGLVLARPSLLLNSRTHLGQAPRLAERLAIPVGRVFAAWMPGAYRPVDGRRVAQALLRTVPGVNGLRVMLSHELHAIGGPAYDEQP
jgi:uncharacterized protein YbjT (DUF2867 family)